MLTLETVSALTDLSGGEASRYSWQGVGGTSRWDCKRRNGARLFLFTFQSGLCPDCGDPLANGDRIDFCHIVSRGLDASTSDEGKGWTPGNLFLGHRACNKAQQARGPVVLPSHLSRPDLVAEAGDYPAPPVLRRMA